MKTNKVIISAVAIMILYMAQLFAKPVHRTSESVKSTQIQPYIHKAIAYPEFAKSNGLEGFVLIQYQITQTGDITIDAMNGSNRQLMHYVENQLSTLNVPLRTMNKQYAKFVFKLY
jgi:hypothetical protein